MQFIIVRYVLALAVALLLSFHGLSKKSLNFSGATAAIFVGFLSFASSYRFGIILILFYYVSSKLTKYKENAKSLLEENYAKGGERNYAQVLASSVLATIVAVVYFTWCGEDDHVSFGPSSGVDLNIFGWFSISQSAFRSYLWSIYVAHYATATADTWASELGVLSKSRPRLVTSFFLRSVPPGTNGGMSVLGTTASAAGGLFIGLIFWLGSLLLQSTEASQFPMVAFGTVCGILGSLIDSLLGATLQATYFSVDRKCIVKAAQRKGTNDPSIKVICGMDILSNEAVNLISILITMVLALWIAPNLFCWIDSNQCFESRRINDWIVN